MMEALENNAKFYATKAHGSQTRKFSLEPYVEHPIRVAKILKEYGFGSHVICAAYLHDVLEDTDVTFTDLFLNFGHDVASLVKEVTNDEQKILELGKATYQAKRVVELSGPALVIKLADRLDNVRDIKDCPVHAFAERYRNDTRVLINAVQKAWTPHKYLPDYARCALDLIGKIKRCIE